MPKKKGVSERGSAYAVSEGGAASEVASPKSARSGKSGKTDATSAARTAPRRVNFS